ncbi:MAG: hypothetical protein R2831_05105 [Chitinophagaceae bacterium]
MLCFKLKLGDTCTDYLPHYSKQYFNPKVAYNIDNLYQDIKNVTETGFKWYWNDGDRFKNIITNYFDNEKNGTTTEIQSSLYCGNMKIV